MACMQELVGDYTDKIELAEGALTKERARTTEANAEAGKLRVKLESAKTELEAMEPLEAPSTRARAAAM